MKLILASGSAIRRDLLNRAGVDFEAAPPGVDEDAYKAAHAQLGPADMALALAGAKALAVSKTRPDAFVLGADQVLDLEGRVLDKARNPDEARARLLALRGKTHRLHAALAIARDGEIVWRHSEISSLTVRDFSDAFLDRYMAQAGDALTLSVGAYAYEGMGAQLFEVVEGDYFAVLGLPLLPLLAFLREACILKS